jgi:hypothetical protein
LLDLKEEGKYYNSSHFYDSSYLAGKTDDKSAPSLNFSRATSAGQGEE